jgi:hypothetical protein
MAVHYKHLYRNAKLTFFGNFIIYFNTLKKIQLHFIMLASTISCPNVMTEKSKKYEKKAILLNFLTSLPILERTVYKFSSRIAITQPMFNQASVNKTNLYKLEPRSTTDTPRIMKVSDVLSIRLKSEDNIIIPHNMIYELVLLI